MANLQAGLHGTATTVVTDKNTAQTMRSGSLTVFATPAMCALMEEAACAALVGCLDPGMGSVGVSLNISHNAPSAMGATITATAKDGSGKSATCIVTVTEPVPETPEDLLKAWQLIKM